MNQNLDPNINGAQPPKKDNTLKIVLIIMGSIFGIIIVGIIAFFFLVYVIFNKSVEIFEENREEIYENYNDNNYKDEENNDYKDEENDEELPSEYSNIEKLTLDELKDLIAKKRSFVIVISQTYCGHCIDYKPVFNEALKDNNIIGYELDLLTLKKSEYEDFNNLLTVTGTPTTFIYIDGVVQQENKEGSVTKEELNTKSPDFTQ